MIGKQADDRWIIEESGEPVGLIVRDEAGYVFHAAATDMWSLDRHIFPNAHAARQAAMDLLRIKRRPPLAKFARR